MHLSILDIVDHATSASEISTKNMMMSALCLHKVHRLYTFGKVCMGVCRMSTRHVALSVPCRKLPKETISAVIRMKKENLELFGKLLKTSKKPKSGGKHLESASDNLTESENKSGGKSRRAKKAKTESVSEEGVSETANSEKRKRGRPKKVKTPADAENVVDQVETAGLKKRGRPKKEKQLIESVSDINGGEASEPRKRGRPKKVTSHDKESNELELKSESDTAAKDEVRVNGTKTTADQSLDVKATTKKLETLQSSGCDSEGKSDEVLYIADPDEESVVSSPSLSALMTFPFFHPSKTEYFISIPKVPDIYIPGYSERSVSDNPFFPSVGTILSNTQPPESRLILKRWRDNLIKELGEAGFQKYQKELFARGVNFHEVIEQYLKGDDEPETLLEAQNTGYWQSAQTVLKDITDVQSVEEVILHRDLCYKGQFDCIARYRDKLMLIDWKTSVKPKATIQATYDNPLQVAAYIGAYNYSPEREMVDNAMIVVCYEDGQPAHTHLMTRSMCIDYWTKWLQRLHTFWMNKFSAKS